MCVYVQSRFNTSFIIHQKTKWVNLFLQVGSRAMLHLKLIETCENVHYSHTHAHTHTHTHIHTHANIHTHTHTPHTISCITTSSKESFQNGSSLHNVVQKKTTLIWNLRIYSSHLPFQQLGVVEGGLLGDYIHTVSCKCSCKHSLKNVCQSLYVPAARCHQKRPFGRICIYLALRIKNVRCKFSCKLTFGDVWTPMRWLRLVGSLKL